MGYAIRRRGSNYWLYGHIKGLRLDRSLRTNSCRQAEELAKEIVAKALRRAHGLDVTEDITLGEFMAKYLAWCESNNRPSTAEKKNSTCKRSWVTSARIRSPRRLRPRILKDLKPGALNKYPPVPRIVILPACVTRWL